MSRILYGTGDFAKFRKGNGYFVDKTDKIAELEEIRFAMFLRPRRFGKSLLASLLYHYYDIGSRDKYEALFKGTKIYANPTPDKGKYLVLFFNFSSVDSNPRTVQESFAQKVDDRLGVFARHYAGLLPKSVMDIVTSQGRATDKMASLLSALNGFEHPVYVIIDEYDLFANTLLAESGQAAYEDLCHGDGFFKHFFSILKAESEIPDSAVERIFITGVSPIVMDDVTSGFNIGTNVSAFPGLSNIVGFTHSEIGEMLDYYSKFFSFDKELACKTVIDWYDNYRFSSRQADPVANTTQVLEHMIALQFLKEPPERPIDANMKQDYAKVKHLITVNNRLNGSFAKIESILEKGGASCKVKESFHARDLQNPENFTSLLYHFGLVTNNSDSTSLNNLVVPNATIQRMLGEIATSAYEDVLKITPQLQSLATALKRFAREGDFNEAINLVASFVDQVFTAMDYIEGEKTVQAIMATLLYSADGPFRCYKEMELGRSFCDLVLLPVPEILERAEHAALMELKYVKKSEKATNALLSKLRTEAKDQLQNYAENTIGLSKDWKAKTGRNLTFHKYCLIFQGGKLIDFSET